MSITVVDVIRDLGLEPTPELSWSVGAQVRDIYLRRHGRLPDKALRPKTNDGGTHCFAIYPDEMRFEIAKVVAQFQSEALRQPMLPGFE